MQGAFCLKSATDIAMLNYLFYRKNKAHFHLKFGPIYCLFFLFVLFPFCVIAQTVKVLDRTSLARIENALVSDDSLSLICITNRQGEVDISRLKNNRDIFITRTGYLESHLTFKDLVSANFIIYLSEATYNMDELVVSANKFEEKKSDVPQQIQVIRLKELAFQNQATTADVMQQTGNVFVQKSQLGGGSPVLRGFEANKVLMVIDGVSLNNAIYRGGHLQNILTVDNSMLEKVEIVFGPGAVLYGSDALGGVMHFHTKAPVLSDSIGKITVGMNSFLRYGTASNEKTGHVDFNIGLNKIAFLSSISYSDFGDLRQGANRNPIYGDFGKSLYYAQRISGRDSMLSNRDVNLQIKSAYQQIDLLEKVLYCQNKKISHELNIQLSTSSDINRYDRLTDMSAGKLKYAAWYYGPQKRFLGAYNLNISRETRFYNKARIIIAYQNIGESRHDRKFGKDILNHREEALDIFTINTDFNKLVGRHEIRYGFAIAYNRVESRAKSEDITTGIMRSLDTRYPDGGSTMNSQAVYLSHTFDINSKFKLTEGVRLSFIGLVAQFNDKTFYPFPINRIQQQSRSANGSIGLVYMPMKDWRFSMLLSNGFRAPNVDDLAKVFESVPGKIILPNPNLKPENTYNGELGLSKVFFKRVKLEGNAFYTLYKGAITVQNSTFEGSDSILYDGVKSLVQMSVNKNEAFIYGINASLAADINTLVSFFSTINYTYGRIKNGSVNNPLDHISPVFGKTGILLKLNKCKFEFFALYNGWKRIENYNVNGEDNIGYATNYGSPAWCTINLRGAYQANQSFQIQLAIDNITDQNYRVFSSGIGAPGRNFSFTVRGKF